MSDKFKYAPGKPGFGTKGRDGSSGLQGLAMYFTDFDAVSESGAINARITNNLNLWKNLSAALPDGRTYSTGDLFFDQDGKTYEINAETNTFAYIFASLSSGGFFLPLGVSSSTGYQRFFNSNTSPKILIDNVYTDSGVVNYSASPSQIYEIPPEDFVRIEFSNVTINNYNPFTVYSSGLSGADDASSIAIVRSVNDNTFRIGNLDNGGNLRNVNLTFDVSSLRQTKEAGNGFNAATPEGTILTNYEIAANSLFDPAFNPDPGSFMATLNTGTKDVSIYWNLRDFTNDTNVSGTLYFFTKQTPYAGIYRYDSSILRPLIFHDVDASSGVKITGLNITEVYSCYMKLSTPNGWTRNSAVKNIFAANLSVLPSLFAEVSSGAITLRGFDVSTNFPWKYTVTDTTGMLWNFSNPSIGGLDGSINFSVYANNTSTNRSAQITVSPVYGGAPVIVGITQPRGIIPPELSLNYSTLDFDFNGNALTSYSVDVSSNAPWNLTGYDSWISPDITSGGAGITTVTFTIDPNNTWQAAGRNDSITFTPTGGSSQYLWIVQQEGPYLYVNTYGPTYFDVNGDLCGASFQNSFDAYITSNVSWTANWRFYSYKFNPTSPAGGSGDDVITVSCVGANYDSYNYTDILDFYVDGDLVESIEVLEYWSGETC